MRSLLAVGVALTLAAIASAQSPQVTVGSAAVDSIPQTTIVPVQRAPVVVTDSSTIYAPPTTEMTRIERRAYRAQEFTAKIDSLVQSRNYLFFANTMQEVPGGMIRSIYADFFYLGMFVDHVEVHLPTERGITQYVEMLNFDAQTVKSYHASQMQWGWSLSFNITDGDNTYHADLAVTTSTGEAVVTLLTPHGTMRYVGWLWDKWPTNLRRRAGN